MATQTLLGDRVITIDKYTNHQAQSSMAIQQTVIKRCQNIYEILKTLTIFNDSKNVKIVLINSNQAYTL